MTSLDPLLAILKDPSARVLFVLDTSASVMGTSLSEEFFDYLHWLRRYADPTGERTIAITDRFAVPNYPEEACVLPVSARSQSDIPSGQFSAGGSYNPLECLSGAKIFRSYAPTHGVFVGDLCIAPPSLENMCFPPDKAIFMLWEATPDSLAQAQRVFSHAGQVLPLFLPGERDYLHACEEASRLTAALDPVHHQPRINPRPRF